MKNQMSDEEKLKMTPYSILNDGEIALLKQIEEVIERINIPRV
jgi:dephospho-CoA kinase